VPAVLTLGARRELAVALGRIAEDNADAAEQLNDAVHEAARLIGANPAVGARRPRLASARYRFWSIPRFRYLLVYTTRPTRLGLCGSCIPRETSRACAGGTARLKGAARTACALRDLESRRTIVLNSAAFARPPYPSPSFYRPCRPLRIFRTSLPERPGLWQLGICWGLRLKMALSSVTGA
jgi:plasmid stabilization system protein ParE